MRADLSVRVPDLRIIEVARSIATVAETAETLGVISGQIAKMFALRVDDRAVQLVTSADMGAGQSEGEAVLGASRACSIPSRRRC